MTGNHSGSGRTARKKNEAREDSVKCEEAVAEPQPKKLLNEEDVATNWLPDDLDQRRLHLNFGQTCGHEIFGEFVDVLKKLYQGINNI